MGDINNVSLSSFPDEIDEFNSLSDLDQSTLVKSKTYKNYITAGQYEQAEQYLEDNPDLKQCGISAIDFNKHSDAITAIEETVKANITKINDLEEDLDYCNGIAISALPSDVITEVYYQDNNNRYEGENSFKNTFYYTGYIKIFRFHGNTKTNPKLKIFYQVDDNRYQKDITIPLTIQNNDIVILSLINNNNVYDIEVISHISDEQRKITEMYNASQFPLNFTDSRYVGFYHYPTYEKVYELTLTGSSGIQYETGYGTLSTGIQNDILNIEGRIIDSDGSAYIINAADEHIKASQQLVNGTSINLVFNWNNLSSTGNKKLLAIVRYTSYSI